MIPCATFNFKCLSFIVHFRVSDSAGHCQPQKMPSHYSKSLSTTNNHSRIPMMTEPLKHTISSDVFFFFDKHSNLSEKRTKTQEFFSHTLLMSFYVLIENVAVFCLLFFFTFILLLIIGCCSVSFFHIEHFSPYITNDFIH